MAPFGFERQSGKRILRFGRHTISIRHEKAQRDIVDRALDEWIPLKGTAAGKKCFILATGPSVNEQDMTKLAGRDCFSISNFFLHKDIHVIKPKFHFFAPYHHPLILENYIDWLRMADSQLPSETNIVLSLASRSMVSQYGLFTKRKIYYLALGGEDVQTNPTHRVADPRTVPVMAFPVVDWLGYAEINLIGLDMNRLMDYGKEMRNFYTEDPRKNASDASGWGGIITDLRNELAAFEQFSFFNEYFTKKKVKLFNLSPDSWLTFIEKRDFNTLLEEYHANSGCNS